MSFHGLLLDKDLREVVNPSPDEVAAFYETHRARAAAQLALDVEQALPRKAPRAPPPPPPPPAPTPAPVPPPAPPTAFTPYMTDCQSKQVPLPPAWGDPAWQRQADLPADLNAAGQATDTTEIWTYTSPDGVCVALPRVDPAVGIRLLGIICQSRVTRFACFWDNIDRTIRTNPPTRFVGAAMIGKGPEHLEDGSLLAEICTECHRGDNVFNVYPGTALDLPGGTNAGEVPYEPVSGQPGWGNPGNTLPLSDCNSCHEVPALTSAYCRTILQKSIGKTMPPPDGAWNPTYAADVTAIATRCTALHAAVPPPEGPLPPFVPDPGPPP